MLTEQALVDRARTVLAELGYDEAPTLDLSHLSADVHSKRFTVAFRGDTPIGHMGFQEEVRGALVVSLTQTIDNDYPAARRAALEASRTVLAALVRDGAETSGEYAVEDVGRSVEVVAPPGAAFLECRVRVPVNFEAAL